MSDKIDFNILPGVNSNVDSSVEYEVAYITALAKALKDNGAYLAQLITDGLAFWFERRSQAPGSNIDLLSLWRNAENRAKFNENSAGDLAERLVAQEAKFSVLDALLTEKARLRGEVDRLTELMIETRDALHDAIDRARAAELEVVHLKAELYDLLKTR